MFFSDGGYLRFGKAVEQLASSALGTDTFGQ